ncbi:hypothetical protein Hanom_Chr12g01074551 [Helianthus anomalus]
MIRLNLVIFGRYCCVVQSIISELESQGALPKSNWRGTLLVVCCGSRLVGGG